MEGRWVVMDWMEVRTHTWLKVCLAMADPPFTWCHSIPLGWIR